MIPTVVTDVDGIELESGSVWTCPREEREGIFAALRANRPVAWMQELNKRFYTPGPGFWAITKHADIEYISRNPELFCSGKGATSIADVPAEQNPFYGNLINVDDPRHQRLRGLISTGFTPAQLKKLQAPVIEAARKIVDGLVGKGEGDFVTELAAPFPIKIICDILGIPDSLHGFVFDKTNILLGSSDPQFVPKDMDISVAFYNAASELAEMMREMRTERLKNPTDDLTTLLVNAEIDGERITEDELASFFVLLVVAGNDTTRTAISQGMFALSQNPDQRAIWRNDFEKVAPTAVEEIVRWTSPVIYMRRTATRDTELRGVEIKEGDKLVLWYYSANRDEDVFDDPYQFDVLRDPNDHVGFGGPGPHFCLGANLARREITVIFREIFERLPEMEVIGDPVYLKSNFINGIKNLPVRWTPR